MNLPLTQNDLSHVVEADKAHVWHHLTQHQKFDDADPQIIVEGKGMRVWNHISQALWGLSQVRYSLSV